MIQDKIREVIKSRKIPQKEIYEYLSIDAGSFSQFINKKRSLPIAQLEKICELLRLELKEMD